MAVIKIDKEKIAGFCVVYLDEDANDYVVLCNSFCANATSCKAKMQ